MAIYLEGVIEYARLNEDVLRPLMSSTFDQEKEGVRDLLDLICGTFLTVGDVQSLKTRSALVNAIFDGLTVLIFDGLTEVLAIEIRGGLQRDPNEPTTERSLRGSKEGFVENIVTNIGMVRRRLRDPNLVVEKTIVGRRTRTDAAILYISDIADPGVVDEIRKRIDGIDIDGVTSVGYIEQLTEDSPNSIFPQYWTTERPDRIVIQLLEGRVGVMLNGTPFALCLPGSFTQFMRTPEDYYERTWVASFMRLFRYAAFFLAISLPAVYIALLSFQPELIPFKLVMSLAQSRKQVPFPPVVEMLLQEGIIQLIIEAGARLPTPLSQTIGVVAGIVLGQAAISANLASPVVIIVITVTTIATFSLPTFSMVQATRVLRIGMLLLAAAFGFYGFSFGWLLIMTHLCDLESVGVPYFAPFGPTRYADLKDSIFRTHLWKLKQRPVSVPGQDRWRMGDQPVETRVRDRDRGRWGQEGGPEGTGERGEKRGPGR
jgi:spore germination protein KA